MAAAAMLPEGLCENMRRGREGGIDVAEIDGELGQDIVRRRAVRR